MLLITCPFGLSSLLTNEIKRLDLVPSQVFPTGCWIDSKKRKDIILLNLSLRIGNKVYLELASGPAHTFEEVFQLVQTVERSHYFKPKTPFKITALSKDSTLHATRSIQAIAHKALVTQLTGNADAHRETNEVDPIEVLVRIVDNHAHILLNTSGDSLHARGRRVAQ
ncbi:MAG: hypothetical protein H6765_01515 [Candidatus Peribacteria bacterium]|nr:MAG: hypothetical protein H6765_01515 [Candidatus Peribacteria bacterium]